MSEIKQDVKAAVKVFVQMLVSIVVREATKKMIKNLTKRQKRKFEDKIKDMSDDQLRHYFDTNQYFKNALEGIVKSVIKVQSAQKTLSLLGKLQSIFEATSYLKSPVSALSLTAPKIILSIVASTVVLATVAVPLAVVVTQDTSKLPAADFSSNVSSGFAPLSVSFTDHSRNATAWKWEFGDGYSSTKRNPTHIYTAAGKYSVKLTARNENSMDSKSGKITVQEKKALLLPIADFSSSVTMGYAPLSIQFTDLSEGASGWNWDFGDGTTSTEQNPTHTFFEAGKHTVKLTISNENGIDSKFTTLIIVPVYAYITNSGSNNVSIIDTTTKKVKATVNTGIRPYGVALSPDRTKVYVTNSGSGSDNSGSISVIDTTTNTITASLSVGSNLRGIAVNQAGTKAYVANSGNGSNDENSVFVIDTATNAIAATVSVGSGPEGVAVNPAGTKVYVANLNSNNVSIIDTATNTVLATVNTGIGPHGVAINPDGTKVFVANRDSENVSVINTFTNTLTSTVPVGKNPFGVTVTPDGTKAYVTNEGDNTVSVIDTATNTVTATVPVGQKPEGIAVTPNGNEVFVANMDSSNISVINTVTNTVTTVVPVGNLPAAFGQFTGLLPAPTMFPVANFSSNISRGYAPSSVQFTDLSHDATAWDWNFGDGNNSTEQNPEHTYSTPGNFTVKLIAVNGIGIDSVSANITVLEQLLPPVANFSSNITVGPSLLSVMFTDQSENATEWNWNFGDGYSSTEQNPTHTFSLVGNYSVNLTVSNANGKDSKFGTIRVLESDESTSEQIQDNEQSLNSEQTVLPHANFSSNVTDGALPLLVQFRDLSENTTERDWNFGDGVNSTEQNPVHTYSTAGNYTVNLTASNENGTDSKFATINVSKATPIISLENSSDLFYGSSFNISQLNASSSVPGTFVYTPYPETLSAGTQTLHVDFIPEEAANYSNVSADITINILKSIPIISWNNPDNITYGTLLSDTQLNASAISVERDQLNGTFEYALTDRIQAFGAILEAGTHPLYADFTPYDSTNYTTASKNVTINVTKTNPTITWSKPENITFGTPLSDTQLDATATSVSGYMLNGFFNYTPAAGTILSSGENQNLHVDFTPTDAVNYNTTSLDVKINVTQANPIIIWNTPENITYGIQLNNTQLNAVANDPITGNNLSGKVNYNPISGTVLSAGTQTLHVDFIPTDAENYTTTSKDVTINVEKATPKIIWNSPANITYGTVLNRQLNAIGTTVNGSQLDGTFAYIPSVRTVLSAGDNQSLHADFTPMDTTNYTIASKNATINISRAIPEINWSNPDNITYGTTLNETQLDATATSVNGDQLSGAFNYTLENYTQAKGVVLEAGTHPLYVDFMPDDAVNYTTASKNVTINISAKPVLPVANFSSDVTEDFVPFSVQFIDRSQNATGWSWDFGDGTNSTEKNPKHTYFSGGNHTVNLTVNNAYGNDSMIATITAFEYYAFVAKWGSSGSDDGLFDYPSGFTLDSLGNFYVADTSNNRIQKFSSDGTFITKWGSEGAEDGQFYYPHGVASDSSGNVYVADTYNNRIQKFSSDGTFITKWGSEGTEDGQFGSPVGVAVDSSGNVYVADTYNNRIQKFSSDGTFITKWGSEGTEDGQFGSPVGIAVDSSGNVYVADTYNNRIQKFSSDGTFITKWGSEGTEDGQFGSPVGVAVDSSGNVYVIDSNDESTIITCIQKFDSNGSFITKWGSHGTGDGQLNYPQGIAVDSSGNVYVADSGNNRIQKFAKTKPGYTVADFFTNVTGGYVPLSVQFSESSKNETEWNWDFGDGGSSVEQNPKHTYYGTGNYSVNLTVSNIKGTSSKTSAINVSVPQLGPYTGPFAYIANQGSNNVYVIDTATNTITGAVPVGYSPWGVAVTRDGKRAYVTNWDSNNVSVIDTSTNTVTASVNVGSSPWGVAVTPDGTKVYVTNSDSNSVSVINTTTNTITDTVYVWERPIGIVVNPVGTKVYVTNWYSQSVSVIDSTNNTITATVNVGTNPRGIAVNPTGTRVYVANTYSNSVSVINTATNTVIATVNVESQPSEVTVTPDGTKAYVANSGSNTVSVIDTATNEFIATVNVGNYPTGVAVTPDGSKVYVTNWYSDTVSVIDTDTNNVTAEMRVGSMPYTFGQFIAPSLPSVPPVANFSSNVTSGFAPLSVRFTDISQNATSWNWDFGDGTVSFDQNPEHTYTAIGNYTVSLTASNLFGTDSNTTAINVQKPKGTFAYIVSAGTSNTISIIDTATDTITTTLKGLGLDDPIGVAVNREGTKMYIANYLGDSISVFDTINRTIIDTVPLGSAPYGVAVSPDGTKAYVTNTNKSVYIIDTATNIVIDTLNFENETGGIAFTPDGTRVYVTNGRNISVIDTLTNTIAANVDLGILDYASPEGIAVTPDGAKVYVANFAGPYDYGTVSVIDTMTNTVTATINVEAWPLGIAVNPAGTRVYVTTSINNNVSVIDTNTNNVTATVKVGDAPRGVEVTPDGTKVYVTTVNDDRVFVIDTATNNVTSSLEVGDDPFVFGQFIGTIL